MLINERLIEAQKACSYAMIYAEREQIELATMHAAIAQAHAATAQAMILALATSSAADETRMLRVDTGN